MKRSRFTEQPTFYLFARRARTQMAEITSKMGASEQTFCEWMKKYGRLKPFMDSKLWRLEEERAWLDRS